MRRQLVRLGTLTIASGQTASNEISANAGVNSKVGLGTLVDLVVYCPTTLPETVTAQASHLESPGASDWRAIYIGGADVTMVAGKAIPIPFAAMKAFRLLAGGAAAADRVFEVLGQVDT